MPRFSRADSLVSGPEVMSRSRVRLKNVPQTPEAFGPRPQRAQGYFLGSWGDARRAGTGSSYSRLRAQRHSDFG